METETMSESRFYMWRAVFALAYADNKLDVHEQDMLYTYLETIPFSEEQASILREDVATPQNVSAMYGKITDQGDKEQFCELARALVWCDGDMSAQEKAILEKIDCIGEDVLEKSGSSFVDILHAAFEKTGLKGLMQTGENKEKDRSAA